MNPIVAVLCETDIATLSTALQEHDLDVIRMRDGSTPNAEQLALILQAGAEHFDAARQEMHARAIRAENALFPAERITALMEKYEPAPGETLGAIAQRMSAEDQEELASLIPWLAEDEGSDHGDRSA